jgi:hypothetical protein
MDEKCIKKKVKEFYERSGYITWFPIRNKWMKIDIFSIFDGIAWKRNRMIFFQMTSQSNKSARENKIVKYMEENKLFVSNPFTSVEVICWDSKLKLLRVFPIIKKY